MRILHIDSGREMRGGQWQALYLMEGLAALGHEQLLACAADSQLAAEAAARGLATEPLSIAAIRNAGRDADLLHAHDAHAHARAAPFSNRRLVVARRVAFALKKSITSRWKYRRAAQIIAVSAFVSGALVRDGINPERITVVHDGVPMPDQPASPSELRVLALDSADPLKGRALIEQASELAGVPVHFSGDLTADVPAASLLVYISESEGLGSAALLAAAHGVPVVASRIGGLPEAVEDGVTGVLTSNDPASIAASIQRVLADPRRALEMGAAGRKRVAEQFTIEAMVRGTLAVYEKVLAWPRP